MLTVSWLKICRSRSFQAYCEVIQLMRKATLEPGTLPAAFIQSLGNRLVKLPGGWSHAWMHRPLTLVPARPHPQTHSLPSVWEKGTTPPHRSHFLDREIRVSACWAQSSSNYESLEGSEKKHQGHLTTFTDLQIIIYSNTGHFLCRGRHRTSDTWGFLFVCLF